MVLANVVGGCRWILFADIGGCCWWVLFVNSDEHSSIVLVVAVGGHW